MEMDKYEQENKSTRDQILQVTDYTLWRKGSTQ
jgi:hypothetical protein